MEETKQQTPRLNDQDSLLQIQKAQTPVLECSRPTSSQTDIHEIISELIHKIKDDTLTTDFLISLFMSALKSYKRDSVLRPFPSICCSQSTVDGIANKNFDKLDALAECIPMIDDIVQQENTSLKLSSLNPDVLQLLWWVLDTKNFRINTVDQKVFSEIKKLTGQTLNTSEPTHIFEVHSSPDLNAKFENERQGRDLIYAYHGSRIENFHSILRNGLCNHMNKNSLFGRGTYLSSELSVCMPYSQTGQGWIKSRIGDHLSCIAVCEIITDKKVRCHTRQNKKMRTEVPEKYYIVQNDELLRVRYLLLFADKSSANRSEVTSNAYTGPRTRLNNWIGQHRFAILIFSYLVLLLAIGLGNSNINFKFLKKYLKL